MRLAPSSVGHLLLSFLAVASVALTPSLARADDSDEPPPAGPDASATAVLTTLLGGLDGPATLAVTQGSGLWVSGWALDPSAGTPPGVAQVQVFDGLDRQGPALATASLEQARPDVAQTLANPAAASSGFQVEIPTAGLAAGTHALAFVGQGASGGTWQQALQVQVAAPAPRAPGQFIYGALLNTLGSVGQALAAGFSDVMIFVSWKAIEPTRGNFLFEKEDQYGRVQANDLTNVLDAASRAGLRLVLRVDDVPDWAGGNPSHLNPADLHDYLQHVTAYAGSAVDAVEVFNEMNLPLEWGTSPTDPAAYAQLLTAADQGAKTGNPNVLVVSAAPSQHTGGLGGTMEDVDWLSGMYQAGAQGSFDLLGMHAYPGDFPPDADPQTCAPMCFRDIERYRGVMDRFGDDGKNAFITEFGTLGKAPTDLGQYAWMELPNDLQASNLVQAYQLANTRYPWLTGAMAFNLDYAMNPSITPLSERYWFSMLNSDGSSREAYTQFQAARSSGTLP